MFREAFDTIYSMVEGEIFAYEADYLQINFPSEGGVTAYFSRNMTSEDHELVKNFLAHEKIDILNTRAFKRSDNDFLITVGSISEEASRTGVQFEGKTFEVKYGEFAPYLTEMNKYLEKAIPYAANET